MKKLTPALFLFWIIGCVPSLEPIWTENDLVYEAGLVGVWRDKDGKSRWTFTKAAEKEYRLVQTDENGVKAEFQVRLAKLKEHRFLDLSLHNIDDDQFKMNDWARLTIVPGHLILLVHSIEPELRIAAMNPDWLKEHLAKHPKAIRTRPVTGDSLVITAATEELQAFVLKHCSDEGLFGDPMELTRVEARK